MEGVVKIAIIGVGAMGSLFGYLLHLSGYSPWLLDNCKERVATIRREGLTVEDQAGTHRCYLKHITVDPEEIGVADVVIICVKSYDTEVALRGARALLGGETAVLTLQNGLNNLEKIVSVTGQKRVVGGATAHGATLLGHGYIRHAGSGGTVIGALKGEEFKEIGMIKEVLDSSGISTTVTDDVEATIWSKLIVNAAINPLTALTRLNNGELIEHSALHEVQQKIIDEACAVARAKGVTIHYHDPMGEVRKVCRATSSNRSSMLQDIVRGKKTEIDYINGAIVEEGRNCHVPTPYNSIVVKLVSALEVQKGEC